MKITEGVNYIRQQQPGQFRRPEDGTGPFAHLNNERLGNTAERKESSVYVSSEKLESIEKTREFGLPKLFDFDAGAQLSLEKVSRKDTEGNLYQQYDRTGTTQVTGKQEGIIDQWA